MPGPDPIENAFISAVEAIAGVEDALDYDPEQLPSRLPVVTVSFAGVEQDDRYTGAATENAWTWVVRLYVPLLSVKGSDYKVASTTFKTLIPELFRIVRQDPSLGGTSGQAATLTDPGEEPEWNPSERWAVKALVLRGHTEEA